MVRHYIVGKHGEYDFGSYKRGFQWANKNLNLANYEELIFCNDSCYGPIYPFENTFDSMSHKNLDFWGITENSVGFVLNQKREFESGYIKHIQSYFIVFKSQIFLANYFIEFIESIQKENLKNLVTLTTLFSLSLQEICLSGEIILRINLFRKACNSMLRVTKSIHIKCRQNIVLENGPQQQMERSVSSCS